MTDSDTAAHRSYHTPTPDTVSFRDADEVEGDEGMMEIRMPIASTGDVRNQGDDPLSGAELRGMAQQVDTLTRGVFPEHGHSDAVDGGVYSQFEKLGYWADADLQREAAADDSDLLVATARMPDPETLPAATGKYRQALAILKEQAKRGIPVAASIGWRDDEGAPGGVDLMEASIVGIPADPRTNTAGGTEALARAAVEAGADRDDFVAEVRRILRGDADPEDARPFGPPGDPNRWESFEECTAEVEDWDGVTDPDAYCGWAKAQTEDQSEQMTDDDTGDDAGTTDEQSADDGDTTERDGVDADEFRARMLDLQEQQMETLSAVADAIRMDDEDHEDDDEEEDDDDEEDEEEQGGDYDDDEEDDEEDRAADVDADADDADDETRALQDRLDELESELEAVRNGDVELDSPQQNAADADDSTEESDDDANRATDTGASEDPFNDLGSYT